MFPADVLLLPVLFQYVSPAATHTGKWMSQIRVTDWTGKVIHKKKRGFETKHEALEWEREFINQANGSLGMLFSDFIKLYFEDMEKCLKSSTIENKRWLIDLKITPFFGKRALGDIKPTDIRRWQNELRSYRDEDGKPYSDTYLKSIHNQVIIYKGWFLPPNIYYDCGSFAVNRKAVVGNEKKPFNRYKSNTKGAVAYDDCYIIKRSLRFPKKMEAQALFCSQ